MTCDSCSMRWARRASWILCPIVLMLRSALPVHGAVQTYFLTGEVTISSFSPIPVGTPYAGFYTFDDAAADTSIADPDIGTYDTGELFIDFGPVIGSVTFATLPLSTVRNNQPILFGEEDHFSLVAGDSVRNTPAFTNEIEGGSLVFADSELGGGTPATLTDDTLTGVPHVVGGTWDDQALGIQVDAVPSGCPAFESTCGVTLGIDSIAPAFLLTVVKDGSGSGTVVSDPAGIDCGATCSASMGGVVTLTASPDPGSVFVTWTGCDSVAGNICSVNLVADRTVTATFDEQLVLSPQEIPTLGEWALILLACSLAFLGWAALRR